MQTIQSGVLHANHKALQSHLVYFGALSHTIQRVTALELANWSCTTYSSNIQITYPVIGGLKN